MDAAVHPEIDAPLAQRIIGGLARKQRKLFGAYPEVTQDEIASEGMIAVLRQWPEYNSQFAQSTFITQRASTAIIDYSRRLKSGKNKMKRIMAHTSEGEFESVDDAPPAEEEVLTDWLSKMQAMAKTQFRGPAYRRGRRFYKIHQLVAIGAMMERFSMSCRKCAKMLGEREDLRVALGLRHAPSFRHIFDGWRALQEWRSMQATQKRADMA